MDDLAYFAWAVGYSHKVFIKLTSGEKFYKRFTSVFYDGRKMGYNGRALTH